VATPGATIVVMPWYPLALPSYQAGIGAAVLRRAGIPTGIRFLTLDFMDHDVREFLDELLSLPLAYEEGGRYLTLPLPVDLKELP